MEKNKLPLLALTCGALAIMGALVAGTVHAAPIANVPTSALTNRLARFHANKADVKKVFAKHVKKSIAKQTDRRAARLDALVAQNKITAEQKVLILAKLDEVQKNMIALKTATPQQRADALKQSKADLTQWAKDNGIDPTIVVPMQKGKVGHFPAVNRKGKVTK